MMSGLPSPFTSAVVTEVGLFPTANDAAGANVGVAAPSVVVFSNTDTVPEPPLATRTSGLPSPFTSAAATPSGWSPTGRFVAAAKVGTAAPGTVVFSNTDTLL